MNNKLKEIWIFNHHALTPEMSGGTRHFDFAKELVKRGYRVSIFASSFHYAKHQEMKTYSDGYILREMIEGVEFIWIKTRPYYNNGISRIINMLDYMNKVQKIATTCKKPDIIIGSSVHLFAVYAAYKMAKKFNIPFVMEVRDIWPQTLIDMGVSKWHPFVLLLGYLEKFLYKKADKIITLLPFAYKHIEQFTVNREKIEWISNGVDVTQFENIHRVENERFVLTYTGSISEANVLHTLFNVAKKMDKKYDIVFQIIGEGNLKREFQDFIDKNNLSNIKLHDAIAKTEIPQVLVNSDLLYVGLKDSPLYKFGISLNKIYDYLASNTPVVFASNAINNPIDEANAGITIAPENEQELEEVILKFYKSSKKDRNILYKGGLNYVENNFSIQFLTTKLEKLLNGL